MLGDTQSVNLSERDLEVIEAALSTQEKILSVQSRAGTRAVETNLNHLKGLLSRIKAQTRRSSGPSLWIRLIRARPCWRCQMG